MRRQELTAVVASWSRFCAVILLAYVVKRARPLGRIGCNIFCSMIVEPKNLCYFGTVKLGNCVIIFWEAHPMTCGTYFGTKEYVVFETYGNEAIML